MQRGHGLTGELLGGQDVQSRRPLSWLRSDPGRREQFLRGGRHLWWAIARGHQRECGQAPRRLIPGADGGQGALDARVVAPDTRSQFSWPEPYGLFPCDLRLSGDTATSKGGNDT